MPPFQIVAIGICTMLIFLGIFFFSYQRAVKTDPARAALLKRRFPLLFLAALGGVVISSFLMTKPATEVSPGRGGWDMLGSINIFLALGFIIFGAIKKHKMFLIIGLVVIALEAVMFFL